MAGQADGRILVDSAIDPQGFEAGSKRLQSAVKSLGSKVESLGTTFQKALGGDPKALAAFQAKAAQLQQTVDRLAADMARLGAQKAPTDAYKDLSAETEKAGRELEKLLDKQEKLDNRGTSKTSQTYKNLQADIEAASAQYDELAAKKAQMEASGTAWTSGTETAEYQSMAAAVDAANARLSAMRERIEEASNASHSLSSVLQKLPDPLNVAKSVFGGILSVVRSIGSAIGKVAKGVLNLAKTAAKKLLSAFKSVLATVKKLFTGHKSLSGSVGGLTSALKKLVPAMLAARGVMGILRKGVNAFLEANEQVSDQLQACWSSLGNILGPIITRIVNLVATAISYVTAFLRLLGFGVSGGASTISTMGKAVANVGSATKAAAISTMSMGKTAKAAYGAAGNAAKVAAVKTDEFGNKSAVALNAVGGAATIAADEINTVGDAAESTAKKIQNLSGLDQINTWKSEQDAGGGGGGGAGGGIGDLGVTLPEVELPDWAKLLAEQLRSGEWEAAAKTLSDKLNEMVDSVDWPGLGDRLGEKMAGVLKFLATFIREFDFVDLFTGLFTTLEHAIDKLDAEDLGALLAAKFVIIFSALQGAVESGIIPTAIEKLGGTIEGFFAAIREKFNDASDPAHGGWYVVGQNLGEAIGQIVNAIASLLSGTRWDQIAGDIGEFWSGLWEALRSGSNAPDWNSLFDAIKTACKRLLSRMLQWLPQSEESKQTWKTLESRLEQGGDKVPWEDIFSALWHTLGDLVDEYLIPSIPSVSELQAFWVRVKDDLAQALDYESWDELTDAFTETLKNTITPALDSFMDDLYEQLRASHPYIAGWLFPERAAIETATKQFQSDLEKYSPEIAARNLKLWVDTKRITEEQARRIAADAGFAYSDGLVTSLPYVEEASEELVSSAVSVIEEATDHSQQLMDESGRKAVIAYLNGLIAEGALTGEEACQIIDGLVESMASRTETYSDELREGGISAARAYLDGLIAEGAVSYEEAAQIAANAADGMSAQGEQFASAAQSLADEYNGKLLENVPGARAAGGAYGENVVDAAGDALDGMSDEVDSSLENVHGVVRKNMQRTRDVTLLRASEMRGGAVAEVDAMAGEVAGGFSDMTDSVTSENATMDTDSGSRWAAIASNMTNRIITIRTMITSNWEVMRSKVQTTNSNLESNVKTTWESVRANASAQCSAICEAVETAWTKVRASIGSQLTAAASTASASWTGIREDAAAASEKTREAVAKSWNAIPGEISSAMSSIRSTVSGAFSSLISSAWGWGSDLGSQLASGIRSAIGRIASAASSAAAAARSYLHFSVPDKGPLADADEYGPDLIKLLADGMTKNKSLAARAASRVAAEISAGIQTGEYSLPEISVSQVDAAMDGFGDKITAGFSSMVDRLQAIADSITFRLPSVTAGVVPYSVAGGMAHDGNKADAALLSAVEKLSARVDSLRSRGAQYTFIGQIDRRVLFREVLDEAKARQAQSGKNPFELV